MTGKARKLKKDEYLYCKGCQDFKLQEDTGETEIIDGRKNRHWKCKACGRINKFCG